mmetsp:Transcript_93165/g.208160  ORF Transcript_93165/g.208160 Transcript_93165/m.208160 type:complete len:281 (-) Transcript_93165:47-889(-)
MNFPGSALIHFVICENRAIYLWWTSQWALLQVIAWESKLMRASSLDMSFEKPGDDLARENCVKDGIKTASLTLHFYDYPPCCEASCLGLELQRTLNWIGIFNYAAALVVCIYTVLCLVELMGIGTLDYASPKYFVWTWRLEKTRFYKSLSYFVFGYSIMALIVASMLIIHVHGFEKGLHLLVGQLFTIVSLLLSTLSLTSASVPPFNWEGPAFQNAILERSAFLNSNDAFGASLSHALLLSSKNEPAQLISMVKNTDELGNGLIDAAMPSDGLPLLRSLS